MAAFRLTAGAFTVVALSFGGPASARTSTLPPFPRIAPSCARADFRSQGGTIRALLCLPAGPQPAPGVVVLHGCGGFGTLDQILARELPMHGIATFYVDYFGLTPAPGRRGFCNAHGSVKRAFSTWQRIVVDASRALRQESGLDPARVGAVGWSLGAGLALVTAEYGDRPVGSTPPRTRPFRALALFSTAAFEPILAHVARLPPTLVLSGGSGDVIPPADAIALYRALRRAHVPASLFVYPHGNHQWKGAQGAAGERHAVAFLRRYLG
ncbi:MAG: dienelactone hydrolase family protein [Gaiellaceae bacterium]